MFFPAERVDSLIEQKLSNVTIKGTPVESIRLGPGLSHEINNDGDELIMATTAGTLQYRQPNKFWLESPNRRRYVPHPGDLVIGRVLVRSAESLKVDIGSAHPAILPLQNGFEASTRRNQPNLEVGAVVYCRVSQADRFVEPEVLCVDADGRGNAFGELVPVSSDAKESNGFMLFKCSINRSWQLQRPACPILQLLGKYLPFEIVVGANGKYAIDSPSVSLTLLIHHWIAADKADEGEVRTVGEKYCNKHN